MPEPKIGFLRNCQVKLKVKSVLGPPGRKPKMIPLIPEMNQDKMVTDESQTERVVVYELV